MKSARQIFRSIDNEKSFRQIGYVVFDLLNKDDIENLLQFYTEEFSIKREVYQFAEKLPYYISVFDKNDVHKKKVDEIISCFVKPGTGQMMIDYEVFYSNFMIKFPGDGQIEAHQDFNFVDETIYTAFNLWCPLVDTSSQNGGLYVIPGSHNVFTTQRGPNIPKALTQYNQTLKKYAQFIPLKKGQAIIFDHKLIHYSPPNQTDEVRIAIQSVLKPCESPALHYFFEEDTKRVKACIIDKQFIFENDLWNNPLHQLPADHYQDLVEFPDENEIIKKLITLKLNYINYINVLHPTRRVFINENLQANFEKDGFVKISLLNNAEIDQLKKLFIDHFGADVKNSDYGMYITLEEDDVSLKKQLIENISAIAFPRVQNYFINCKPHLGSFLVKAPGKYSYTYPHQDWTFVDSPQYCSVTIWIALVDTNKDNGTLGFIKGSHLFFDGLVGSPSPDFKTLTQGHEDIFYEYLEFISLKAGEAIAFDNRTIHGAAPNTTKENRAAVAIGVTPEECQLYHYYLVPNSVQNEQRKIAKLKVDETFFHRHSVKNLKQLYAKNLMPEGYETVALLYNELVTFSRTEMLELCKQADLQKNGESLDTSINKEKDLGTEHGKSTLKKRLNSMALQLKRLLFKTEK